MSPPVLPLPNDVDLFILDTDAAEDSIGAVLSQLQNGEEKVIAFLARSLDKNEVDYCITRKELLAVVHFVKHFWQYLLGRTITISTDQAALSWLKKTHEPIGQNARWLEQLGEYDFVISHRKGTSRSNADALSRHCQTMSTFSSWTRTPLKIQSVRSSVSCRTVKKMSLHFQLGA